MSTSTLTSSLTQRLGRAQKHVIPGKADRDLGFSGWCLSRVTNYLQYSTFTQGTEVSVYVTEGERIVTQVRRWEERAGGRHDEESRVAVHDGEVTVASSRAVAWLADETDNRLNAISEKAWADACRRCPHLKGEHVKQGD